MKDDEEGTAWTRRRDLFAEDKEKDNVVSLRAYVDELFKAARRASDIRHASIDCKIRQLQEDARGLAATKAEVLAVKEATRLAKDSIDDRLEDMNEFRRAMNDQADTYLTRNEYAAQHKSLEDRLCKNDEDIRMLRESRAELAGKASQSQVVIAYLFAIVGIALGIAGLLNGGG
jgi:hypothetical protein